MGVSPLRIGLYVLAAIVALVLAVLVLRSVGGWLNDPFGWKARDAAQAKTDAVQGRADGMSGRAQGDLIAAGAAIADKGRDRDARTVVIREANRDAIRSSPGADAPLDPRLVARWRSGLCDYAAYHDDPACVAMRAGGPGELPEARPRGTPATP